MIQNSYIFEGTDPKGTIIESLLRELARWKVREGGGSSLKLPNFLVGRGGVYSSNCMVFLM